MILISLNPFSPKRVFLFFAAAICFSCVSSFAQPVFIPVKSTPYDNQMSRVKPILQRACKTQQRQVSLSLVNHWIGTLHGIPYAFSQQWKTPPEVETAATADCKGKAIALYEKMQAFGASDVRLIIGKRSISSRSTHAWVEWSNESGTYVLDPTINCMAYKNDRVSKEAYVPFYAYSGNRKFSATGATLLAAN
jgi:hypothetical protein